MREIDADDGAPTISRRPGRRERRQANDGCPPSLARGERHREIAGGILGRGAVGGRPVQLDGSSASGTALLTWIASAYPARQVAPAPDRRVPRRLSGHPRRAGWPTRDTGLGAWAGLRPDTQALTGAGRPGRVKPAGSCTVGVRRAAAERDRGIGSAPPDQIDHLLEQVELVLVPYAAADDDTLPRLGPQASGDDRRHVIAPVQADQACLDADTVLREPGYARLDRFGYRPGVPRSGNPVRIEPNHQDAGRGDCRVHLRNATRQRRRASAAVRLRLLIYLDGYVTYLLHTMHGVCAAGPGG
jgi:hypothetical protein